MLHLSLLFFATLIAAVLASAPPGLLNLSAAKTSLKRGTKSGVMFGVGVAIIVMFQAYLAVRIGKFLSRNPDVLIVLMQVAVVIFALLTLFFFWKAKRSTSDTEVRTIESAKAGKSIYKGMVLGALNLLQIPFYSALNSFFNAKNIMNYLVVDEVFFIIGAGAGTFLVMYLYVFYFNKLEHKTSWFSKNSNYILSALMFLLFVITSIRIFYK